MPTYYTGVPINYSAIASTQGSPSATFTYKWVFDDGTTSSSASVTKVWATVGDHIATISAVDTVTSGSDTASKTITISAIPTRFSQPFTRMSGTSSLAVLLSNGSIPETSSDYSLSWTLQAGYPPAGTIALSGDGVYGVIAQFGYPYLVFYTSNSGASWVDAGLTATGYSLASISRNGGVMAVGNNSFGGLHLSTNYGSLWVSVADFVGQGIYSVAISSTGQYLYVYSDSMKIGTSSDYGATWTPSATSFSTIPISFIQCNDNGNIVALCGTGDYIYISSDNGSHFTKNVAAGVKNWSMVAVSGSGTRMLAIANGSNDYIYASPDSGSTWSALVSTGLKNWNDVLISQDGFTIVASWWDGFGSRCLTSFDFGLTWV